MVAIFMSFNGSCLHTAQDFTGIWACEHSALLPGGYYSNPVSLHIYFTTVLVFIQQIPCNSHYPLPQAHTV